MGPFKNYALFLMAVRSHPPNFALDSAFKMSLFLQSSLSLIFWCDPFSFMTWIFLNSHAKWSKFGSLELAACIVQPDELMICYHLASVPQLDCRHLIKLVKSIQQSYSFQPKIRRDRSSLVLPAELIKEFGVMEESWGIISV